MGLGPQRKDSKTFGTTVYGLTHPNGAFIIPFFKKWNSYWDSLLLVSDTTSEYFEDKIIAIKDRKLIYTCHFI